MTDLVEAQGAPMSIDELRVAVCFLIYNFKSWKYDFIFASSHMLAWLP